MAYLLKDITTSTEIEYETIFDMIDALWYAFTEDDGDVIVALSKKLRAGEYTGEEEAYLNVEITQI